MCSQLCTRQLLQHRRAVKWTPGWKKTSWIWWPLAKLQGWNEDCKSENFFTGIGGCAGSQKLHHPSCAGIADLQCRWSEALSVPLISVAFLLTSKLGIYDGWTVQEMLLNQHGKLSSRHDLQSSTTQTGWWEDLAAAWEAAHAHHMQGPCSSYLISVAMCDTPDPLWNSI